MTVPVAEEVPYSAPEYVAEEEEETYAPQASTSSEQEAKEWIANKESGGDYGAVNPSGKYIGRYQLDQSYLNGDHSPANQEKVADEYVAERYGSWTGAKQAWQQKGWY